jgi:DNA-binding response OmpR family regulator
MSLVLLIEPDRVLAETYRQALMGGGHQVVCCASAQAAIISADQHRPDAVILELQLIEHSGIEFLYEFRSYRDWQHIPVILHTHVPPAEFNDNYQLLRDQLGVKEYLYKPDTSLRELVDHLEARLAAAV